MVLRGLDLLLVGEKHSEGIVHEGSLREADVALEPHDRVLNDVALLVVRQPHVLGALDAPLEQVQLVLGRKRHVDDALAVADGEGLLLDRQGVDVGQATKEQRGGLVDEALLVDRDRGAGQLLGLLRATTVVCVHVASIRTTARAASLRRGAASRSAGGVVHHTLHF